MGTLYSFKEDYKNLRFNFRLLEREFNDCRNIMTNKFDELAVKRDLEIFNLESFKKVLSKRKKNWKQIMLTLSIKLRKI